MNVIIRAIGPLQLAYGTSGSDTDDINLHSLNMFWNHTWKSAQVILMNTLFLS